MLSLQQLHQNVAIPDILRNAGLRDVPKVQEAHQDCVLLTEVGRDVINLDAIKVPRAVLHTAKPTVAVTGVRSLVAPKVQKEKQIIALLMVEAAAVNILAVLKLPGVSLGGASSTTAGFGDSVRNCSIFRLCTGPGHCRLSLG